MNKLTREKTQTYPPRMAYAKWTALTCQLVKPSWRSHTPKGLNPSSRIRVLLADIRDVRDRGWGWGTVETSSFQGWWGLDDIVRKPKLSRLGLDTDRRAMIRTTNYQFPRLHRREKKMSRSCRENDDGKSRSVNICHEDKLNRCYRNVFGGPSAKWRSPIQSNLLSRIRDVCRLINNEQLRLNSGDPESN